MGAEARIFGDFLKSRGLKRTSQRQLVLKEVFSSHGHFEVEELLVRIRASDRRVSRASLYRTLKLLVESGLLREMRLEEKHGHYEHTFGHQHHDHLLCIKCGKLIEFRSPSIEKSQQDVSRRHGFSVTGHRMQIMGYCRRCRV